MYVSKNTDLSTHFDSAELSYTTTISKRLMWAFILLSM